MTEQQPRPAATRGRSSTRGGRGGFSGRGGHRNGNKTNGDLKDAAASDASSDQGELGELKKRYSAQLNTLRELFPDWTDVDFVMALQESDGDLQATIERITEGNVTQFAEIKKKSKDRSRSKVKDTPAATNDPSAGSRPPRNKNAADGSRGGRGRPERGRGGSRGSRGGGHGSANGLRNAEGTTSVPTNESSAWDTTTSGDGGSTWDQPSAVTTEEGLSGSQPGATAGGPTNRVMEPEVKQKAPVPDSGTKKTWASMFAQPKPAPLPPKPATKAPQATSAQPTVPATPPQNEVVEDSVDNETFSPAPGAGLTGAEDRLGTAAPSAADPDAVPSDSEPKITPSKDELTEDNLEHVPDSSGPALTETAASTVASSRDIGTATPSSGLQQLPIQRPAMSGYASSALRAATQGRTASFQKRILEQQEAVVMPSNHAVDRAAVQFGSMGLNGNAESDGLDVDEDREEAETRAQPPQQSPPSQPRAALPPAQRQQMMPTELPPQEALPAAKPAMGLPPAPSQQMQGLPQQQPSNEPQMPPGIAQQVPQGAPQYGQFGRYGQPSSQLDSAAPSQKQYDPFGQQAGLNNQFDVHPSQSQAPSQPQLHAQSQAPYSSAPMDQSSYYTSEYQRNAYQNYYGGSYGQHGASAQQEAGVSQQRASSGFGAASTDSGYPASQAQQPQSRYAEAPNSGGQNTPNPLLLGQTHSGTQSQQSQHLHQQPHHSQTGHGGHPYGHPYYSNPYFNTYMNQYGYGGQNYGGPYGAKGGVYGQPHHGYGMSPQNSYDQHSSSPGNVSGFGQSSVHGRENALASSLGEYGRSGSTQPSQAQQPAATASSFGNMPDILGRSHSGLPGQNQQYAHQQASQHNPAEDALKPFGDAKASVGPNAAALSQPGRPGSAANNATSQAGQSGLPPPQSHQQGFGGYSSHLNHVQSGQASQYSGLSGLGGHQGGGQSHQSGGYGGYGTGFGNSYGNYSRGGWGGNYGH